MQMIEVQNDGPNIVKTNYWLSEWNKKGIMACSLNAGDFRILLPDSMKNQVPEMKTGKEIIISKGIYRGRKAYEILFDDHTSDPYCLHMGDNQMVSLQVADSEQGKSLMVSVWVRGPKKVLDMPARFRVVDNLPYLKPWGE
jgi:hypothetical protein